MRFLSIFLAPVLLFGSISSDLSVGLRALQQIRSLIPERLSEEEFSIIVDKQAFAEMFKTHSSHEMNEKGIPPVEGLGCSHYYYNHWTISGDSVRILDFYQQFEYGPYWLYPTAIQRLYDMQHQTTKTQ